jgi:hypothetical protein
LLAGHLHFIAFATRLPTRLFEFAVHARQRFPRRDLAHLEIQATIDEPKAVREPLPRSPARTFSSTFATRTKKKFRTWLVRPVNLPVYSTARGH